MLANMAEGLVFVGFYSVLGLGVLGVLWCAESALRLLDRLLERP